MMFLFALSVVLLFALVIFAVVDWIVGRLFARGERLLQDRYPEDFLYADMGRLHREVDLEVERLAARVPPPQYTAPTAGAASRARGPYRTRTAAPRLGAPDRQSEYGEGTSLIGKSEHVK